MRLNAGGLDFLMRLECAALNRRDISGNGFMADRVDNTAGQGVLEESFRRCQDSFA